MRKVEHEQAVPAAVWHVQHNLMTRYPILDTSVMLDGVMQKIMPSKVIIPDMNSVEIHWARPTAGKVGII